jgi:hypothetical protein
MEKLRHVSLGDTGYELETWDTNKRDGLGKYIIRYSFTNPKGEVLFEGEDFACSPMHLIDGDGCLRSLLTFLTLRPGDTDREYFDNYTEKQMAFAEGDAEYLQLWMMENDEEEFWEIIY